jgi:hypothetical protein
LLPVGVSIPDPGTLSRQAFILCRIPITFFYRRSGEVIPRAVLFFPEEYFGEVTSMEVRGPLHEQL